MITIGQRVAHRRYGQGTVSSLQGGIVRVLFEGETAEKSFVYPDAFDGYLVAEDPQVQGQVMDELRQSRERLERERAARRQEWEAELEEQRQQVLETAKQRRKKPAGKTAVTKVS